MNYLGHFVLAGPDRHLRLGAFLGDFITGPLPGPHAPGLARGLALHRFIDRLTDSDPVFRELKGLAPAPLRRFMPIALDVIFDHCLARHFSTLTQSDLEPFCEEVIQELCESEALMPAPARATLAALATHRVLPRYRHWEAIQATLERISQRRPRLGALQALPPLLEEALPTIEAVFLTRFPVLEAACEAWKHGADSP